MSTRNAGIDEAGRGPAIGPLVVCSLCIPSEHSVILEEIGVKDSKNLSSRKRDGIYSRISELAESHGWGVGVVICEPSRIDYNSINSDLNSLEIELFAEAMRISTKPQPAGVLKVDACDVNEERFGRRLSRKLGDSWKEWKIESRHGMDSIDVVTSASSIIAKVKRDSIVSSLSEQLGIEIGSGYPSDQKTKRAVRELVAGPTPHECLRWSWKTVSRAWSELHGTPIPIRSEDGKITSQSTLEDW